MKKGIVMQIQGGRAMVMQTGGAFLTIAAKPGWQVGDIVSLQKKAPPIRRMAAIAACLVLLFVGSVGAYTYANAEAALVSIDMAPSIEFRLNRMGRIRKATAYNEEAALLLAKISLTGKTYAEAIELLLHTEQAGQYLAAGGDVDISVCAPAGLSQTLIQASDSALQAVEDVHPRAKGYCHGVDQDTVDEAHAQGMTPGKYLVFLDLQAQNPDLDAADYTDCHTGEMRRQMRQRHRNGQGGGQHHNPQEE